MPPEEVPPALVVLTAPEDAPFLCLAPPALPPALGDEVPLGLPAPTLVALAAGPGISLLLSVTGESKACWSATELQQVSGQCCDVLSCQSRRGKRHWQPDVTRSPIGRTKLCWNYSSQ